MSEESEGSQLRSYEDFLQQSVETSSLINYKPVKKSKIKASNNEAAKCSTNNSSSSSDNRASECTETAAAAVASDGTSQLVLIKYKSKTDGADGSMPANRKREIHSLLFFVFFLFVTIITLSQIIVMHSQTSQSNFYQIKLMQEELKLMDASIDRMLKERHVLPINVSIIIPYKIVF